MTRDERARTAGKVQKQKNVNAPKKREAELPGNQASVVAELKNRGK